MQAVAAIYFVVDGIEDVLPQLRTGPSAEVVMEGLVALALLLGVVLGARHTTRVLHEARHRDSALDAARGAMSAVIERHFRQWNLSPAEAEVALFALKGSTIAQIAAMRGAAQGTVRSQLSQVYAKAGVRNQSTLVAMFVDELLDPLVPGQ
ncbi:hypothetical protein EG799_08300 [Aurantiacibacter spongiae]|uniref:HTH luxR-type domain-containing protein n=1 Tax=Aurantiacibacter spongiae TaxID=2488860 RepID=A0A3N5DTL9_9SPHN|nr:hypothetical protein EG799_08300 [Aurantiacibacter spongiae]